MENIIHVIFLVKIFLKSHIHRDDIINPKIYPPVGPSKATKPDLKDEKTGRPTKPSSIHTIIDKVAFLPPIKRQVTNTPNV